MRSRRMSEPPFGVVMWKRDRSFRGVRGVRGPKGGPGGVGVAE